MKVKGHLLYYPEGKHDINLDNYIQKSQLKDALKSKVDSITKITYADLKNLRDNSQLIPGSLYRITDYQCTTTQENTRSAGHQFDIVLLALSKNKLAEEGWAMEHPTDVWDIQLHNGVVKKGYLYFDHTDPREGDMYNVVIAETLMGMQIHLAPSVIDEENKIINMDGYGETEFLQEGLQYSYFQNSNLSAWKVWYCLDNDTARFAWADDSLDEDTPANITVDYQHETIIITRDIREDREGYFGWRDNTDTLGFICYTTSQTPSIGDTIYKEALGGNIGDADIDVESFTPGHEGTSKKESIKVYISAEDIAPIGEYTLSAAKYQEGMPESIEIEGKIYYIWGANGEGAAGLTLSRIPKEGDKFYFINGNEIGYVISYQPENLVYNGRGVIYRLIDEFNNDIKYDFKNIQFKRTITDGQYDEEGDETWCYTLNVWYEGSCQDASVIGNTLPNDEGYINGVYDNNFGYATAYDLFIEGVDTFAFALGNNVVLSFDDSGYFGIYSNTIGNSFYSNTIGNEFNGNIIGNYFNNNIIGNIFNSNTVGNFFNDITISDGTNSKNYGNNGVELATKDDLN